MSAVDGITSTAAASGLYSTTPARAPKQTLDSEAFMSLLVTQLKNQDPSSPMDTNAMIGQTTQLAMMEQLTGMNKTSDENLALQMRIAASALIGQQVSYLGKDGTPVTGKAGSVSFAGGVPTVTIDGVEVNLDSISGITAASAS